jgi:hypothetical protein
MKVIMKTIPLTLLAGFLGPFSIAIAVPEMRDAATPEDLSLAYRKAGQADPMKVFKPVEVAVAPVETPKRSMIADSDILCFNGDATLVPKRAVLSVPKNVAGRLEYVKGSRLKSWAAFYAINRGWITTVEVSRNQAEGNDPIPEKTREMMQKSGNLVVATYQGGPISVLPPAKPEESVPPIEIL